MHTMGKSDIERIVLWIVKIGLWLVPLLPLYISSSMLFPFITGKNFTFRIIIEAIFAFWVGLAFLNAQYRPRVSPLFKAVTIFTIIVFLADLLSPNPYRSFFSNYERMEGFMMLGHLYLYFVMLSSVFMRRDWMVFFHVSLAASLIASYFGLLQRLGYRVSLQGGFRVDSTIGNPTYFAAYLLFHVWMLAILIRQFWKRRWQAALYAAVLVFELAMIYFTATRGVVLALALVFPLVAGAAVVLWPRIARSSGAGWSRGRQWAAGALALAIIVPALFWSVRGAEFVQNNQALRRLTNYSIREGTIQDRFLIWGMSLRGVLERPILGWGQENYYLVFQKYFNPGLYGAEPWFDRSHNVILDWAVHTGVLGLGAYLAIFGVFFRELWRMMRRDKTTAFEGLLLMGLFASYFIQNFFVFDNLNSYLLFFAFLAYGDAAGRGGREKAGEQKNAGRLDPRQARYALGASVGVLLIVGVWGFYTIIRPMQESRSLIRALGAIQGRVPVSRVEEAFREALRYRTFGDTEVHEQLGNIARDIAGAEGVSADERKRFTSFALEEIRRETARSAKDVKHLLFITSILNRALPLDAAYAQEAEAAGREAVRLSPTKQAASFELAQLYLSQNRVDEALQILVKAWRPEKRYRLAAANVWTVAIFARRPELVAEVRQSYALTDINEEHVFNIARAYQQVQDFDGAREAYAALAVLSPTNAKYRATYAALLQRAGQGDEARRQAQEAIRLDPAYKAEGERFLRGVR